MNDQQITDFIAKWKSSGGSERANYVSFLIELCDVLDVPHPDPAQADLSKNEYDFEHSVVFQNGDGTTSIGRIDLYKKGCFVCEAKQGTDQDAEKAEELLSEATRLKRKNRRKGHGTRGTEAFNRLLLDAKGQAEKYARALPSVEGRPPFLLIVDVGYCIDLYAEFSRTGGDYTPFPDARTKRILIDDLSRPEIRELLRTVWLDPLSLDPSKRSAKVTRKIADSLAQVAKSLEFQHHPADEVAQFLMRCLFTMFAEDVELLPHKSFENLLKELRNNLPEFKDALESLWREMDQGGWSATLRQKVVQFNGGLFADGRALPVDMEQLNLLIEAAEADWRDVEPAIFGTLLERALDPVERHKLGAHYTPRAYVERLVMPTVIDPLRDEWKAVQAAARTYENDGENDQAISEVKAFHHRLCEVRVLDPACGSGNFLYVVLEHLKRLEGEVLELLMELGEGQTVLEADGFTIDPHNLLGIEVNPRAAAIAELVLWIGYLQWHFRTRGNVLPRIPVIQDFKNIECRDAVLEWDSTEPDIDPETGIVRTRWDGRTTKKHPITGELVPDETARIELKRYINPRPAKWPKAEFIVGNPPFIGGKDLRASLGDGYAEALWKAHKHMPESADFVMYWWDEAARLVRHNHVKRFGFITTNSLRQVFNRRVINHHLSDVKKPLSIIYAIPDHPWVTSADGAAVRIAMTVSIAGAQISGELDMITSETKSTENESVVVEIEKREGLIFDDLTTGANLSNALPLSANEGICCRGVQLMGAGFIVSPEKAEELGLGRVQGLEKHIRPYLNGRDLMQTSRNMMVIDLFGLEIKEVQSKFPHVYQHILERVKPERDQNRRSSYKKNWWIFGEPRKAFRPALIGLPKFISTVETSKHRVFVFLDGDVLPDNRLVNFAFSDYFHLGILSSKLHVTWSKANEGQLGPTPIYTKTRCFDPFPFPDPSPELKQHIRELGERLDGHRKARQAEHSDLTLTGMYNALEALREGRELTEKERDAYDKGLVGVLKQIHDELDAAVAEAYGWPADLADEEILERLVALNAERAAEEAQGKVRWLRPEYQAPHETHDEQMEFVDKAEDKPAAVAIKPAQKEEWPKSMAEQAAVLRRMMVTHAGPITSEQLAQHFKGATRGKAKEGRIERIESLVETLAALGQARSLEGQGSYTAVN